jgi:hypothetical protein
MWVFYYCQECGNGWQEFHQLSYPGSKTCGGCGTAAYAEVDPPSEPDLTSSP